MEVVENMIIDMENRILEMTKDGTKVNRKAKERIKGENRNDMKRHT